jgi:hypothetical protein
MIFDTSVRECGRPSPAAFAATSSQRGEVKRGLSLCSELLKRARCNRPMVDSLEPLTHLFGRPAPAGGRREAVVWAQQWFRSGWIMGRDPRRALPLPLGLAWAHMLQCDSERLRKFRIPGRRLEKYSNPNSHFCASVESGPPQDGYQRFARWPTRLCRKQKPRAHNVSNRPKLHKHGRWHEAISARR